MVEKLKSEDGVQAVGLDGVITRRLVEAAREKGVKYVVGVKEGDLDPEIKNGVRIINKSKS